MPKKENIVHCIGFDKDGCLLSTKESKLTMIEANHQLWRTLNRQKKEAFAATFIFLFSSNQSCDVDEVNRRKKNVSSRADDTSCFVPVKQIAEQQLESTLCPVLLADAYAAQPDGYSYARAVLKADDDTAYHPGFVFDKNKTGLLYTQVHTAANNMRNCDFLSVTSRPSKMFQLPCKSNAAYVYIEEKKTLLYVNKAKQEESVLTIRDVDAFNKLRDLVNGRITKDQHDFEMLHENDVIRGITLSDAEITEMDKICGHKHIKQDYLIIYDAIDDLEEIMATIYKTYKDNSVLLPRNVLVRLNLYTIDHSDPSSRVCYTIRGTGPIDLSPKETLVKMAKQMLNKETLQEEDFNNDEDCFAAFIAANPTAACFKTRSLSMPTVKHEKSNALYARISDYHFVLPPDQFTLLQKFVENKRHPALSLQLFGLASRPVVLPILFDNLERLWDVTKEEDMPKALGWVMGDFSYSTHISANSKVDLVLRALDAKYRPKPALVEKKEEKQPEPQAAVAKNVIVI